MMCDRNGVFYLCERSGMRSEVLTLFEQMLESPVEPDRASFGHAISSAAKRFKLHSFHLSIQIF